MLRRGEMMQVVSNLIANSIYAMPTGGVLAISVEDMQESEDGIRLTIQDDGVGIAADDLPKVFDAFFTTRTTVGTGIGLFVAKQFVEGHGGRIDIESRNRPEDHGTAVRLRLHRPRADACAARPRAQAADDPRDGQRPASHSGEFQHFRSLGRAREGTTGP